MIGLLLSLIDRLRRQRRDERKIFAYWDGNRRRWGDPLVIQRALDRDGKNWPELFNVLALPTGPLFAKMPEKAQQQAVQEANQASEDLAALVRKAFGVEPLSDAGGRPAGLTDTECLELLAAFLSLLADLREEARPMPSLSPPSLESPSASSPIEPSVDSTLSAPSPAGSASVK